MARLDDAGPVGAGRNEPEREPRRLPPRVPFHACLWPEPLFDPSGPGRPLKPRCCIASSIIRDTFLGCLDHPLKSAGPMGGKAPEQALGSWGFSARIGLKPQL